MLLLLLSTQVQMLCHTNQGEAKIYIDGVDAGYDVTQIFSGAQNANNKDIYD